MILKLVLLIMLSKFGDHNAMFKGFVWSKVLGMLGKSQIFLQLLNKSRGNQKLRKVENQNVGKFKPRTAWREEKSVYKCTL